MKLMDSIRAEGGADLPEEGISNAILETERAIASSGSSQYIPLGEWSLRGPMDFLEVYNDGRSSRVLLRFPTYFNALSYSQEVYDGKVGNSPFTDEVAKELLKAAYLAPTTQFGKAMPTLEGASISLPEGLTPMDREIVLLCVQLQASQMSSPIRASFEGGSIALQSSLLLPNEEQKVGDLLPFILSSRQSNVFAPYSIFPWAKGKGWAENALEQQGVEGADILIGGDALDQAQEDGVVAPVMCITFKSASAQAAQSIMMFRSIGLLFHEGKSGRFYFGPPVNPLRSYTSDHRDERLRPLLKSFISKVKGCVKEGVKIGGSAVDDLDLISEMISEDGPRAPISGAELFRIESIDGIPRLFKR